MQLQIRWLIENRCNEAVPERQAIHKLNVHFFLQKIKIGCKYKLLHVSLRADINNLMLKPKYSSYTVFWHGFNGVCNNK